MINMKVEPNKKALKRFLLVLLVFTVAVIGLAIAGLWIYDGITRCITRVKVKDKAEQIVETIEHMDSRLGIIETLIAEHGSQEDYLSARAVSKSDIDRELSTRRALGIGGDYSFNKDYEGVLNQLALDQIAYQQFLVDESRNVYDTNSLLLFFCYDKESPIKNKASFRYIPKNDSTFTFLHNLDDLQKVLELVKIDNQENRYVSNALSVLDSYQNTLDYIKNLEYIVFVNYSSALFPRGDYTSGTRGSVSVKLDVYQIDNQRLVDSIKVFAESSSTIKAFNGIVTQNTLDEDIQHNLEREIVKALTR